MPQSGAVLEVLVEVLVLLELLDVADELELDDDELLLVDELELVDDELLLDALLELDDDELLVDELDEVVVVAPAQLVKSM